MNHIANNFISQIKMDRTKKLGIHLSPVTIILLQGFLCLSQ
jgi:hypothetical protein